jgi:hypothetical protein
MTVYLDMDGVIADFFGAIEEKFGVEHWKSISDMESKLCELHNTPFFYNIKPFEESEEIVEMVQELSEGDWGICSSPLRGDMYNSAYWKRNWLDDRGWLPSNLEKLIFTGNKHKYSMDRLTGNPNILIDDKPRNVMEWEKNGGIGILFQCNRDDPEYLRHRLEQSLEIAKDIMR